MDQSASTEAAGPTPSGPGRWRSILRHQWAMTAIGVLVVPILVATTLTAAATATVDPSDARVVSVAELQEDFGVRFDLIGVTASGGLVDLRFTVLDATKAKTLFHDASSSPALYVEGSGNVLRTRKGMSHRLDLVTGGRYFLLFSNSGGAIQAGTQVSIVIDGVRLEPIAALS